MIELCESKDALASVIVALIADRLYSKNCCSLVCNIVEAFYCKNTFECQLLAQCKSFTKGLNHKIEACGVSPPHANKQEEKMMKRRRTRISFQKYLIERKINLKNNNRMKK